MPPKNETQARVARSLVRQPVEETEDRAWPVAHLLPSIARPIQYVCERLLPIRFVNLWS